MSDSMPNHLRTHAQHPTFQSIEEIQNLLDARFHSFAFHTLSNIPHPKELLHNMEASLLVCKSILQKEKIVIVGDYDADGICATCIMLDFFEKLGYKKIAFAMPNRFIHGYGFSKKLFAEIIKTHPNVKLIITVDNGVSSFEAGVLCKENNIDFIITDHHTLERDSNGSEKIPESSFLINPQQQNCTFPYKEICGSLVAWYFCCAIKISMQTLSNTMDSKEIAQSMQIEKKHREKISARLQSFTNNLMQIQMESFLLLVGIAIIADVMPLNAINHTICKYALKHIPRSSRHAFVALMEYLKCSIDSQTLGFRLIPLLNAAGRIHDGKIALEFMRAKSLPEARFYLKQLKNLNSQRKTLQDEVTTKAFAFVKETEQNENMLCAVGDDWHEGVLGIVAGKMADEFQKPCFVLTHSNGMYKGSGRSYGCIDLIASMQKIGHLMQRYGGHVGAVGLEIKDCNIKSFMQEFEPIVYEGEKKEDVLGILESHLITHELLGILERFEPYGNGNPLPRFLIELPILQCRKTGQGFLEFYFQCQHDKTIKGMFFNPKYAQHEFCVGEILQFRATLALDFQSHYTNYNNSDTSAHNNPIMLIIDRIYGL